MGEDLQKVIATDSVSLDAIIGLFQDAAAEFASVRVWLVVVEGHHFPPKLLPTITGGGICLHGTLPPINVNAPLRKAQSHEVSGVLLHRGDGEQAVDTCNRLAAKTGARLVANRMVTDVPAGLSPSMIWWITLHCKLAPSRQGNFENQAVWVHNPLVDSLQVLAGIKRRLAKEKPAELAIPAGRRKTLKPRGAPSTAERDAELLAEFERGVYKSQAAFARAKKMEPSTMRHLLRRAEKAGCGTKSKRR